MVAVIRNPSPGRNVTRFSVMAWEPGWNGWWRDGKDCSANASSSGSSTIPIPGGIWVGTD